jgi:hypothetical protein
MPLQKSVRGLSDLLGLFQGGAIPLEWGQFVTPTIDFVKFLGEPIWRTEQIVRAFSIGQFNQVEAPVPDNEKHIVWHLGIRTVAGIPAAEQLQVVPQIAFNSGAFQVCPEGGTMGATFGNVVAQQILSAGVSFPGGLVLNPADQLGWLVVGRTGATNITAQVAYQYTRLKV